MDYLFVSSPCPSPDIGDYVMMESCIDTYHGDDIYYRKVAPRKKEARRTEKWRRSQLPPPLTCLSMMWRRYTTDDGRLIIVQEKAKSRDYFRATRSDGRLKLELVAMEEERENRGIDDMDERENVESGDVDERENVESCDMEERENVESCDVEERENMESDDMEEREKEESDDVEKKESVAFRLMGEGRCYDYMRVRSSPCLLSLTLPTVRPVHI